MARVFKLDVSANQVFNLSFDGGARTFKKFTIKCDIATGNAKFAPSDEPLTALNPYAYYSFTGLTPYHGDFAKGPKFLCFSASTDTPVCVIVEEEGSAK